MELSREKSEEFYSFLMKLEDQKKKFHNNVVESTGKFSHYITDYSVVQDFPELILQKMAVDKNCVQQGPWKVSLHPSVYENFLMFCPNRDLRWNAWRAHVARASGHDEKNINNSVHIEEIRPLRNKQAQVLGYQNFAEMSMETKMAGTVDNVLLLIAGLLAKGRKKMFHDIEHLQQYAEKNGISHQLQAYDIPFWRQKYKEETACYKSNELKEYFQFNHVLRELLKFASYLFNISFERVSAEEVPVWHHDVHFYRVIDSDGKEISGLYIDPYKRPNEKLHHDGSSWVFGLRSLSQASDSLPLSLLIFNFSKIDNLLTFSDVNDLFMKFGHALQHLLTKVPYGEVSGITNVEWDAVETCSNFFLNWLYEPHILRQMSKHYQTGAALTDNVINNLIGHRYHLISYDLCKELYLAHLDLQLYTKKDFWLEIVRDLWDMYHPYPLQKLDAHLCSFTPIFSDVWPAAYYSHIWSKVLAANITYTFKECSPEELPVVGKRFRDTFLSMGGGCHPGELFRQFCGHDPSTEALNKLYRLSDKGDK